MNNNELRLGTSWHFQWNVQHRYVEIQSEFETD